MKEQWKATGGNFLLTCADDRSCQRSFQDDARPAAAPLPHGCTHAISNDFARTAGDIDRARGKALEAGLDDVVQIEGGGLQNELVFQGILFFQVGIL